MPFSVFNTFTTYDVSAFFNNVDLSGFRLVGNGENAGLKYVAPAVWFPLSREFSTAQLSLGMAGRARRAANPQ